MIGSILGSDSVGCRKRRTHRASLRAKNDHPSGSRPGHCDVSLRSRCGSGLAAAPPSRGPSLYSYRPMPFAFPPAPPPPRLAPGRSPRRAPPFLQARSGGQAALPRNHGSRQVIWAGSMSPCDSSVRRSPIPSLAARAPAVSQARLQARGWSLPPRSPARAPAPASPRSVRSLREAFSSLNLNARLHLVGFLEYVLDRAHHIERLLRNLVVLSCDNVREASHRILNLDVLAFQSRELRGHKHRLR